LPLWGDGSERTYITPDRNIRDRALRNGGPKAEVAQDLIDHRRLPDKKKVKHRMTMFE
jgi:hypothetical protein